MTRAKLATVFAPAGDPDIGVLAEFVEFRRDDPPANRLGKSDGGTGGNIGLIQYRTESGGAEHLLKHDVLGGPESGADARLVVLLRLAALP